LTNNASKSESLLVCLSGNQLLVPPGTSWQPLTADTFSPVAPLLERPLYLGTFRQQPCYVRRLAPGADPTLAGFEWVGLRSLLGQVPDELFHFAGRAVQVSQWACEHRFCGRCGSRTELHHVDRATVCSSCEALYYPRLSPCVIGIIEQGDRCLLARHARSRSGRYSALAGFIEPGETAEQALAREVKEEVGLEITNIRYCTSQPWPFPGQLMLGFHADYAGGKIEVDGVEIEDAAWFHAAELPPGPPPGTISGQLIQDFVRRVSGA
jgi:NAD+ diphosphatase